MPPPPPHHCACHRTLPPCRADGLGYCLNATVRYVPSYSTSLLCDGCDGSATLYDFRWQLTDAAAQW